MPPQKLAVDTHAKVLKHPHIAALKRKLADAHARFTNLAPVRRSARDADENVILTGSGAMYLRLLQPLQGVVS